MTATLAERRQALQDAITLWVCDLRLDTALKREELGDLEGGQRHFALSKSLIPNVIRICRRHPRADTRLGGLILTTLLSDNNEGRCRLGVRRIAQLLRRKEDNVRGAIDSLEEGGELFVDRTDRGLPNSYWPAVPAAVATMNPAMAWFVDALSDKPAPRGRPRNSAEGNCPPPEGELFDGNAPPQTGKPSPADGKIPPAKPDSTLLKDISTQITLEEEGGAQVRQPTLGADIPGSAEQGKRGRRSRLPDGAKLSEDGLAHALDKGWAISRPSNSGWPSSTTTSAKGRRWLTGMPRGERGFETLCASAMPARGPHAPQLVSTNRDPLIDSTECCVMMRDLVQITTSELSKLRSQFMQLFTGGQRPHAHVVTHLLKPLHARFKRISTNAEVADLGNAIDAALFGQFSAEVCAATARRLIETHDSDWMPPAATILRVVREIHGSQPHVCAEREQKERLTEAMRGLYPFISSRQPQVAWPADLGPAPGALGSKVREEDLIEHWRNGLEAYRSALHMNGGERQEIGASIVRGVRAVWRIDILAPDCPLPRNLLNDFGVPTTRAEYDALVAAKAVKEAERRAAPKPVAPPAKSFSLVGDQAARILDDLCVE